MEHSLCRRRSTARQLVEIAEILGARLISFPVPKVSDSDDVSNFSAHCELASFSGKRGIQFLVEDGGCLKFDPDSIQRNFKAIVHNITSGPDTGNRENDVRYKALEKSFPGVMTCDFKVFELDDDNHHAKNDILRCFHIGWMSGSRGSWPSNTETTAPKSYVRKMTWLRDQLTK